jgi:deazaflavin-dependent oxidoreductase (nitroreductase family)
LLLKSTSRFLPVDQPTAGALRAVHSLRWVRLRRAVDTVDSVAEVNEFNRNLIDEFRANKGKVTGPFEGAPLLLLTTTGAKSGRTRTNPVVYTRSGDRLVIIASKGGAPTSPDWYHNLVANPTVTVELPDERFDAKASTARGEEHDRLFAAQAALMPHFNEYQQKTTRQLPVVVLERI